MLQLVFGTFVCLFALFCTGDASTGTLSTHLIQAGPLTTAASKLPFTNHGPRRLTRRAVDIEAWWAKAFCRGSQLSMAMIKNEAQAQQYCTPVRSPWDGDLKDAFATWNYREVPGYRANLCDFGRGGHEVQRAFAELGIGTASSEDGGPNQCFYVEHKYGPNTIPQQDGQWPPPSHQYYMVGKTKYRATQAYTTLGINPVAGALYFLNRTSPKEAAAAEWNIDVNTIQKHWLPDLSSSSDHAWGFWWRTHHSGNLANINKIFSCMITNDITLALIDHALKTYPLPAETPETARPKGVEKWPGTTFPIEYDAAHVLLGSPNGLAAGYFLAQHKHRWGKNKSIEKITVFRPDKGMMPYLLFWVIDAPAGPAGGGGSDNSDTDSGYDSDDPSLEIQKQNESNLADEKENLEKVA